MTGFDPIRTSVCSRCPKGRLTFQRQAQGSAKPPPLASKIGRWHLRGEPHVQHEAARVHIAAQRCGCLAAGGTRATARDADGRFPQQLSASDRARVVTPFHRGLGEEGFVEGRTVAIEYRFPDTQYERLPAPSLRGQLTPDFELNSKIQTSVGNNATLRGAGAKKKSIFFGGPSFGVIGFRIDTPPPAAGRTDSNPTCPASQSGLQRLKCDPSSAGPRGCSASPVHVRGYLATKAARRACHSSFVVRGSLRAVLVPCFGRC